MFIKNTTTEEEVEQGIVIVLTNAEARLFAERIFDVSNAFMTACLAGKIKDENKSAPEAIVGMTLVGEIASQCLELTPEVSDDDVTALIPMCEEIFKKRMKDIGRFDDLLPGD